MEQFKRLTARVDPRQEVSFIQFHVEFVGG